MNEHNLDVANERPDERPDELEAGLERLSAWEGSVRGPLERAMQMSMTAEAKLATRLAEYAGRVREFARGMSKGQIAAALAVGTVGLIIAGAVVPAGRVRGVATQPLASMDSYSHEDARKSVAFGSVLSGDRSGVTSFSRNFDIADGKPGASPSSPPPTPPMTRGLGLESDHDGVPPADGRSVEWGRVERVPDYVKQEAEVRQIIRRAQVDVIAADVQIAFRKAQDLIKPERGEFLQETTLSGAGQAMTGRVVLRVEPGRLAETMQAARGLGELASEQAGGDDVTDQLADLDARIRNEQRVEKEMLELFDLRKEAPLKEVLDLREQIARVRNSIERMQAQRAQTGRLVSFATLTISIRPKPDVVVAPPVVNETPSFSARLTNEVGRAWERGTANLAGSAGWLVETAIGGIPLWTTLGVTGFVIWRIVRKRKPKAAANESGPA